MIINYGIKTQDSKLNTMFWKGFILAEILNKLNPIPINCCIFLLTQTMCKISL